MSSTVSLRSRLLSLLKWLLVQLLTSSLPHPSSKPTNHPSSSAFPTRARRARSDEVREGATWNEAQTNRKMISFHLSLPKKLNAKHPSPPEDSQTSRGSGVESGQGELGLRVEVGVDRTGEGRRGRRGGGGHDFGS